MFGYIKPYEPYLYKKDEVLYNSLYCGVCKSIGANCGQIARMSLTYDIAFLSCFAHNIAGQDVNIKKQRCIAHPFKKRAVAIPDEISNKLAYVNLILAKHKLTDDKIDSKKGFFKGLLFNRSYRKSAKKLSEIDRIVKSSYDSLRKLESANNGLIDPLLEVFGNMLAELSDQVFGENKSTFSHNLFFALGKWIYLIDAVDDYEKDLKKGEFNPFITRYNEKDFKSILEKNSQDFDFMFSQIFSEVSQNFYQIKFKFNRDLLENILIKGLPNKTAEVIKQKVEQKGKKHVER